MKILKNNIHNKNFLIKLIFLIFLLAPNISNSQQNLNNDQEYKSIKSNNANMRLGPGWDYEIIWNFKKEGLPVKIIKKFKLWYQVETPDGSIGWMKGTLLNNNKTIIFKKNDKIYKNNNANSRIIAQVDKNSVLKVHYCKNQWCKVESKKYKFIGFVKNINIWGAYVFSAK